MYGFVAILIFSALFFLTFVYEVARGGLDWGPLQRSRNLDVDASAWSPGADRHHHHPAGRHRRPAGARGGGLTMGVVSDLRDDGLAGLSHNVITSRLEDLVKWARSRSSWPANFGLACCAIEMMATGGAHYDLSRFGMEVFRASPRQADIMIVAGRVSQKMAPVLRQVYDQMMEPKWVISMGVCASTGGMFNNYAIVQGVDQIVPVDVYAPGCPPTPETLLHAIETLHQAIEDGELMRRRATGEGANLHVRRDRAVGSPCRSSSGAAEHDRRRRRRRGRAAHRGAGRAARLPRDRAARAAGAAPDPRAVPRRRQGAGRRRLRDVRRPHGRRLPRPPRPTAARRRRRRALRGRRQPARPGRPADGSACACRCPSRRPDGADAVRPPPRHRGDGAGGRSTCSASSSPTTPT